MPRFMTRVVLHDAADDRQIYEDLHQYMADAGFSKTIRGETAVWELPDAMYDYRTSNEKTTSVDVRAKARAAADKTKKKHSVMTVCYTDAAWANLDRA